VKRVLRKLFVDKKRIASLSASEESTPLFDTIYFEVRTRCNSTCSFCAAAIHSETRPDTNLPETLYKKSINELAEVAYTGRVAYHVNNDPLLFTDLPTYVKYASDKLPNARIQVLTNGLALNLKKATTLIDSGINELTVNCYTDDTETLNRWKKMSTLESEWAVLGRFPQKYTRIAEYLISHYGLEGKQSPFSIKSPPNSHFKDFEYSFLPSRLTTIKTNRAGTAPNKRDTRVEQNGFCEYPFTQFNVTTDGRVSKCCADLYFEDVMGNIKDQTIMDIWASDQFSAVRKKLLVGRRENLGQCHGCDFYGVKNVNSLAGRVLRKFGI